MIDRDSEELMTLPQAASTLPGRKAGKPIGTSTVWRWAKNGCAGIRLETTMIGATMYTSREALDRLFDAVQAKKNPQEAAPQAAPRSTPKRDRKRREEAKKEALEFAFGKST